MRLVKPSFEILSFPDNPEKMIEIAGRTCYKSEDKITEDSAPKFTEMLLKRGHNAMVEFGGFPIVKIVCDRGVTHEIVRHRLFSFAQESTRYCNYKGGVTFVIPPWVDFEPGEYTDDSLGPRNNVSEEWFQAMLSAEEAYLDLVNEFSQSPQQARSVLPDSLKTEIVVGGNTRQWRHLFAQRTNPKAHPQMIEIAKPLAEEFAKRAPTLYKEYTDEN